MDAATADLYIPEIWSAITEALDIEFKRPSEQEIRQRMLDAGATHEDEAEIVNGTFTSQRLFYKKRREVIYLESNQSTAAPSDTTKVYAHLPAFN